MIVLERVIVREPEPSLQAAALCKNCRCSFLINSSRQPAFERFHPTFILIKSSL